MGKRCIIHPSIILLYIICLFDWTSSGPIVTSSQGQMGVVSLYLPVHLVVGIGSAPIFSVDWSSRHQHHQLHLPCYYQNHIVAIESHQVGLLLCNSCQSCWCITKNLVSLSAAIFLVVTTDKFCSNKHHYLSIMSCQYGCHQRGPLTLACSLYTSSISHTDHFNGFVHKKKQYQENKCAIFMLWIFMRICVCPFFFIVLRQYSVYLWQ